MRGLDSARLIKTAQKAQHGHLLALEQSRHKPKPLIHLATLPPRHFAFSPQRPEVLPMSPE
jgi:hypothetical protein